jgi:hypothetical protein
MATRLFLRVNELLDATSDESLSFDAVVSIGFCGAVRGEPTHA